MPLADARALFRRPPHIGSLTPDDDRRGLQKLANWAYRFVPIVAIDGDDGLFLDTRGCAHLYAGIDRLARRMLRSLIRAGIAARIAAAPTFGAAWALARFGSHKPITLVGPDHLKAALDPLPAAALRLSPECLDGLSAVGIERIEHLRAIPRASLAARFTPDLLLRLDQALGTAIELITPIRPRFPTSVEHLFEGPTDHLDSIALATRRLMEELATLLAARQRGALSLRIELLRSDLEPLHIPLRTSEPCADARHLWKLLEPKLEKAHLGFGVEGVRLVVVCSKHLRHTQTPCWRDSDHRPAQISQLIDTLHARLGDQSVTRPIARESYLPERAFTFAPILSHISKHQSRTLAPSQPDVACDRPTLLHATPLPIAVGLLTPDGPLATLQLRGTSHPISTSIGPERLAGEWWKPGAERRDYFKVQTHEGRWLWIFRTTPPYAHSARWFLHGEWA
jgi:protein ImuB